MDKRPLITICVGHSRSKPGAKAVPPLSVHEYEYNCTLAIEIELILAPKFRVYVAFRDGLSITQTYNEIEKLKPDANIELHFNSAADPKAKGTETLCNENSVAFAKMIQAAICAQLGRPKELDRGVKVLRSSQDRGYSSVSRLNVPNVLIEPFFGSNKDDAELGLNKVQNIAEGVYKALDTWFYWD